MSAGALPDGTRGFDANGTLDTATAMYAASHGYAFAVRYIRRARVNPHDVTSGEVATILEAGLALMLVQHVASENAWTPSADLGRRYGAIAANECRRVGLPLRVTVWLDLEGVRPGVRSRDVVRYCNGWHDEVAGAGYRPGLYVGWHSMLTAVQLYRDLRFDGYWSAYNLNRDEMPIVRGVQMRQVAATLEDLLPGFTNDDMDVDVIAADALGGTPTLALPMRR